MERGSRACRILKEFGFFKGNGKSLWGSDRCDLYFKLIFWLSFGDYYLN